MNSQQSAEMYHQMNLSKLLLFKMHMQNSILWQKAKILELLGLWPENPSDCIRLSMVTAPSSLKKSLGLKTRT